MVTNVKSSTTFNHVKKVNTLRQRGKSKRVGRNIGMTRSCKKAIVTLAPGHKIDVFF